MKKILSVLLAAVLVFGLSAYAESVTDPLGVLFECGSSVFSMDLAKAAFGFSSHYSAEDAKQIFSKAGMEVILQARYDKAENDITHTSAYTLGSRQGLVNGEIRTIAVITVRGTYGGEWVSNFDFAPSHSDDTIYAENFMLAATDVYAAVKPELDKMSSPVILVTGHSRGAAVSNLLATLLNGQYGTENVFAYTFATPTTICGDWGSEYTNIFNFINPADVVPYLPLASMGYHRAGTDILLPGDVERAAEISGSIAVMSGIAEGISDYYETRKPLTADMKITPFEFMQMMLPAITGNFSAETGEAELQFDETSPYLPLLGIFGALGQDQDRAGLIVSQHMPNTYLALMNAYEG